MCLLIKQIWFCNFQLCCLLILLVTTSFGNGRTFSTQKTLNSSIPAIFIFGDSTVDPGNNNFIKTAFKSDFPPYGIDFSDQTPTGRFTDGKLVTDIIASYLGSKQTIPGYLDPAINLKDLITGVSFASAGSGYDPLTSKRNSVIPMLKQLEYFDEYKKKLQQMIGKKRMEEIVKKAIYIASSGTNDILYTFGIVDSPVSKLFVPSYQQFLLNQSKQFIQGLMDRGARKILIAGVAPVGCLPVVITLHSSLHEPRKCVDSLGSITTTYNQLLKAQLNAIQASQPTRIIVYGDVYGPIIDQFNHPQKYGFEVVDKGCCGTGSLEAGVLCNSLSSICHDRSKYIFWDSIHPTERSYSLIFESTIRPLIDLLLR